MLLVEYERNPRREIISFLAGLALNIILLLIVLVARFESTPHGSGVKTAKSILIAPAAPPRPAPLLAHALATHRYLLSFPAPQTTRSTLLAPADLPPLLRSVPAVTPMRVVAPPPPPPAIVTGGFETTPIVTAPAPPAKTLRPGGFAATEPVSLAQGTPSRPPQIGSFGSTSAASTTGTTNRNGGGLAVQGSGFEAAAIATQKPHSAAVTPSGSFQSAEILNKPKPDYTEEARTKRVEGEVWLEVLFGADGTPRVQRVLRSLGYGLDENAIRSARLIRFRPAREGSREVDQVATVRVQFQLAE
jgi:TonB family protein